MEQLWADQSEIVRVFRARAEIQISLFREQIDHLMLKVKQPSLPKLPVAMGSDKRLPKVTEPHTARKGMEFHKPNPRAKRIAQIPMTTRVPKPPNRVTKPPFRL